MIDVKFGLWWSGAPVSFLRFLTIYTLRHYHPNNEITLYFGDKFSKNIKWGGEQQDFQNSDELIGKDYREYLCDYANVVISDEYEKYPPNYQSDFFRWDWLSKGGGFYLDMDQIICKNFSELGQDVLSAKFLFSEYKAQSCGIYTPVGVIGASHDAEIVQWICKLIGQFYDEKDYNSLGPWMLRTMLRSKSWKQNMLNLDKDIFYPVPESYLVPFIYDGTFEIPESSFALHWFGGHPASQEFNKKFTPNFAKTSNDTISRFIRKNMPEVLEIFQ